MRTAFGILTVLFTVSAQAQDYLMPSMGAVSSDVFDASRIYEILGDLISSQLNYTEGKSAESTGEYNYNNETQAWEDLIIPPYMVRRQFG
jgi:hypothetical protein